MKKMGDDTELLHLLKPRGSVERTPLDMKLNALPEKGIKLTADEMLARMDSMKGGGVKAEVVGLANVVGAGGSNSVKISPDKIIPSRWANRHKASFEGSDFESLNAEIQSAGGNVQAIKVRPISNGMFEIAFGHRRHKACQLLNLQVLAVVDELTDVQLFEQMDRENRNRADLSPYEQGEMYSKALREGLFPSMRQLSKALGVDLSAVSRYVQIAQLPLEVLNAFNSPLEIQQRWATPLGEVLKNHPELLLVRAKALIGSTPKPSAADVFKTLVGEGVDPINSATPDIRKLTGRSGECEIKFDRKRNSISIQMDRIDPRRIDELEKIIGSFLE